jgi:hypothetical protein
LQKLPNNPNNEFGLIERFWDGYRYRTVLVRPIFKIIFPIFHANPSTITIFLATAATCKATSAFSKATPAFSKATPAFSKATSDSQLQSEKHLNHHQNQHRYPQSHCRRCFNDRCHLRRHHQSPPSIIKFFVTPSIVTAGVNVILDDAALV